MISSTYFGGSNYDYAKAIKADNAGNVFITGYTTSSNFPTQNATGAYFNSQLNNNSGSNLDDVFLLKFSNSGNLIFSTFIGGSSDDQVEDLSIDNAGNVFIVGSTFSSNFPTISGGGFNQATLNGNQNGFIQKFSNAGAMLWSSYFGGNLQDVIYTISNDLAGNIFIGGSTNSNASFPLQNNGTYFNSMLSNNDAFVTKFGTSLNLVWSSYYGGNGNDVINSSAINNNGDVYFSGSTCSSNFPTFASSGAYLNSNSGGSDDVVLLEFDNAGNRKWATYFG